MACSPACCLLLLLWRKTTKSPVVNLKLAISLQAALVFWVWQSDLDSYCNWQEVPALSLSWGPSLADWVSFLSWPVTWSRSPTPDLVIERVAWARAQVFKIHRWHIKSCLPKWPVSCVAAKKMFVVQILHWLVHARHEYKGRYSLHPCNSYFFNWNSTCVKFLKNFAAANK